MFRVDGICVLKSASILQYISDIGITGVDAIVVKGGSLNVKSIFIQDYYQKCENRHQLFVCLLRMGTTDLSFYAFVM
jgi:hypothetical protein